MPRPLGVDRAKRRFPCCNGTVVVSDFRCTEPEKFENIFTVQKKNKNIFTRSINYKKKCIRNVCGK